MAVIESLETLREYIVEKFQANEDVKSVYDNEALYVWNNMDCSYPSVCFNLVGVTVNEETTTYTYQFYAGALQHESIEPTTNTNYNQLYNILESTFQAMESDVAENSENLIVGIGRPRNYEFAPIKTNELLAVASVQVGIDVLNAEC